MRHTVTEIQRFCMHDGPGIRTTVFLKGCPLRCFWCHNPETQASTAQLMFHPAKCIGCRACTLCPNGVHGEADGKHAIDRTRCTACGQCVAACPTGALALSGSEMTSEEIIELALRDKAFYGTTGGITLSGGEPMLHPKACIELLRLAKDAGLHTAVETCGYFPSEYLEPLARVTDLFLWDVKDTDDGRHRKNTGVSNERILQNLRAADAYDVPIVLRCILLRGINLNDTHLRRIGELYCSLQNAVRVDLLPCHSLGSSKAEAIGIPVPRLVQFEPTQAEMDAANQTLREYLSRK